MSSNNGYVNTNSNNSNLFSKILIGIVAVIFFILLIIFIISTVVSNDTEIANNPVFISGVSNAENSLEPYALPVPLDGNNFSFSSWIYIEDYTKNYNLMKNIFTVTNSMSLDKEEPSKNTNQTPGLYLDASANNLIVNTSTVTNEGSQISDDNVLVLKNIPLRKWINIVYVLDNNVVDIYLQGRLEQSKNMEGIVYTKSSNKLYIGSAGGNTFNGKIGQLQYFTKALNPGEISKLYTNGLSNENEYVKGLHDKINNAGINIDDIKNNICDNDLLLELKHDIEKIKNDFT